MALLFRLAVVIRRVIVAIRRKLNNPYYRFVAEPPIVQAED